MQLLESIRVIYNIQTHQIYVSNLSLHRSRLSNSIESIFGVSFEREKFKQVFDKELSDFFHQINFTVLNNKLQFTDCLLSKSPQWTVPKYIDRTNFFKYQRFDFYTQKLMNLDAVSKENLDFNRESVHLYILKLRIIVDYIDSSWHINHLLEPYSRLSELKQELQCKVLSSKLFYVKISDNQYKFKTLPRPNIKAQYASDFDECIWFNSNNYLCEGSFTNVFYTLVDDDILYTPDIASNILPGTMRQQILNLGAQVRDLHFNEIQSVRNLYLSNAMLGLTNTKLFLPKDRAEQNY